MTELYSWLWLEAGRDMGWTLIHFLWQGLLLAALLRAVLPLCRSATSRHNCALATLAMMALAPTMTFAFIHDSASVRAATAAASTPVVASSWLNWLVILWLGGIAVLGLRALGGLYLARSLGRHGTLDVPAGLLQRFQHLQRHLAPAWPARFLLSRRIDVPMVIGWFRPVVLIPLSAVTGLAPAQLDALILHELAHIRRFDTITNILLTTAETVLFYHPAVWWVSRQVRIEREHCCDDLAVSACGDVVMYIEALTALKPWKKAPGAMVLAANGGRLKNRVARLLGGGYEPRRSSLPAVAGLALLGLLAGSVAMAQTQAPVVQSAKVANAYPSNDKIPVMLRPIQGTHALPPYPEKAIHLKEKGRVMLAVTIGTDGAVSRASVVRSSGYQSLDDAALQSVKSHWRWQPPTLAGKPTAATTRVSVRFDLKPPKPKQPH